MSRNVGSICRVNRAGGHVAWEVRIRHGGFSHQATFDNEAEAADYLCNTNIREGLNIKNRFTVFEDQVTVKLPNDMVFICNADDIDIVEAHIWCANGSGYVVSHFDGATQIFHNMVLNHRPGLITVKSSNHLLAST
jgi:hypothetical protein